MKRILISLMTIGLVAGVGFAATQAFFSDTETSTGNILAAGAIDLKIDNTSYVTDANGDLVASTATSWNLRNLTVEKFFNFRDLKPGDIGEDTISVHVDSNNAWLCAAARVTDDSDQTCTEPELADDPQCTNPGLDQGDLASQVNFAFWADDGDNVLEQNETPFLNGPISGLGEAGQIALADSTNNVWGVTGALPGGSDRFIGKAWCFGELSADPFPPLDESGEPDNTSPLVRGTGFDCDGSAVNNAAQTDKVVGDLQFYAVQSRNNADFTCAGNYTPNWSTPTLAPTP